MTLTQTTNTQISLCSALVQYILGIRCLLTEHYRNMFIQIQCNWKILPPKTENFQIKNSDIFHISAKIIDCGYSLESPRRGGSNEYPQSMFDQK